MRNLSFLILVLAILSVNANPANARKRQSRGTGNRPTSLTISTKSMVRGILENMTRAIEIYSTTRRLSGARKFIASVERDVDILRKRVSEDDPLMEHLQDARYRLIHAEFFFKAKAARRRVTKEELNLLTEMAWSYNCTTETREGFTDGIIFDKCITTIMDEAKESQRQAFRVAATTGFYSP